MTTVEVNYFESLLVRICGFFWLTKSNTFIDTRYKYYLSSNGSKLELFQKKITQASLSKQFDDFSWRKSSLIDGNKHIFIHDNNFGIMHSESKKNRQNIILIPRQLMMV